MSAPVMKALGAPDTVAKAAMATVPADLVHDRQAAVLMRGGRAARLCPVANSALADIIAAGGVADTRDLALSYPAARLVRKELRRMNPALARIGVRIAIDEAGIARLRVEP